MGWRGGHVSRSTPGTTLVDTRSGAAEYELILRGKLLRGESLEAPPASEETVVSTNMRFDEFAKQWFETYVLTNNKPSEQKTKRVILRAHLIPRFGHSLLSEISTQRIEQFKAHQLDKKLSRKTVNNHLAILSRCLRCAMQWGYLDHMPIVQRLRVGPPRFRVLTDEECMRVLADRRESQWNLMAHLGLRTGMRRGELLALDWSDVDIDRCRVYVRRAVSDGIVTDTKTYQSRPIPLMTDIRARLATMKKSSGLVFPSHKEKVYSDSGAEKAIKRIAERAGIVGLGWHTLRHTFATNCANAGVSIHTIKDLLGHSTITMTMRYVHGVPSMLDEAIRTLERSGYIKQYPKSGQPVGTSPNFQNEVDPFSVAVAA